MIQWMPGDPLDEKDYALLLPLKEKARELGRTPTVAEVPSSPQIKRRFRIWKNAVMAAGLPSLNSPEQTRLRSPSGKCE